MIKKIKVFIASSIEDLREDRLEIGDFFRQLNEIYIDKGVHFTLIKCEDYDNAMVSEGKQAQYDKEIRDSDISFFLFFRKLGEYTKHEFMIALESFKNTENPKIVTYFKYINNPEELDSEVSRFMNMLGNELNHYYNYYGNIDTLKLGMLMQIKLLKLDDTELKVEDGKVKLDGADVVSCKEVPMFGANKNLKALYEQRKTIDTKYYQMREACTQNPDLYDEFYLISEEKKKTDNAIKEIEEQTLFMAENMCREAAKGNLTKRQTEGYRLLEKGDIEGALEVLDFDEIIGDIKHHSKLADMSKENLQKNVDELCLRAYTLCLYPMTEESLAEINKIYETACEAAETYNLSKDVLYTYVEFLQKENELEKALKYAERLEMYYRLEERNISREPDFCVTLSLLYISFNRFEEAEKYLKETEQEYWRKYLADKTAANRAQIGMCNINLSKLYWQMGDYKKAMEACETAMGAYDEIHKNNVFEYTSGYATACVNLATLYQQMKDYEKALLFIKHGIALYDEVIEQNMPLIVPRKTSAYISMAAILKESGNDKDAETCLRAVIKACDSLIIMDPFAHEEKLANAYLNMSSLECIDNDERIEFIVKAEKIFKRYYERMPEVYRGQMGVVYFNMGLLYFNAQMYGKAENALKNAISIRREGASKNPAVYEDGLASAYHSLALTYEKRNMHTEAQNIYAKAKKIYTRLAETNPEMYKERLDSISNAEKTLHNVKKPDATKHINNQKNKSSNQKNKNNNTSNNKQSGRDPIAEKYKKEGNSYWGKGRFADAIASYEKALAIYENMGEKGEVEAAVCKGTLGNVCCAADNLSLASKYYIDSIKIFDKYALLDPKKHEPNQAAVYYGAGKMLRRMGEIKMAVGFMWKSVEIRQRLSKENPREYEAEYAQSGVEMGRIYNDVKEYKGAEREFNSVLNILEKSKNTNNDNALEIKAEAFQGLALTYEYTQRISDAVLEYTKALDILEKLVKKNPRAYINWFIECSNSILVIHRKNLNAAASAELYLRMTTLYELIADKLPEEFIKDKMLSCYTSLGHVYLALMKKNSSKEYFKKAYDIRVRLAQLNPDYKKEMHKLRWKK